MDERRIKKLGKVVKCLMVIMFLLMILIYAGWLPKTPMMIGTIIGIFVVIVGIGQYKARFEKQDEEIEDYGNGEILTIADLLREYADCPQDFEVFCAELFRKMGYATGNTAKTNDGGYDMWMQKDGISYIAECKLYASDHVVGRPLIQKLVGANATQRADKIVFITTSSFSKPAKAYAAEQRVWLIDGNELQTMMDNYL